MRDLFLHRVKAGVLFLKLAGAVEELLDVWWGAVFHNGYRSKRRAYQWLTC